MGIPVLVYGKSGSGKSRSLKYFSENEIYYVNVENKPLPFRGKFKYVSRLDDVNIIQSQLSKMPTKIAVIDDAGYIMTHTFMSKHRTMKGNAQFDMYNEIADNMYNLVKFVKDSLPADVIVYIIMHEETTDYGITGLKTLGKLLDQKVCMEGMVTVCIRCMSEGKNHFFRTVTDGNDITKTPEDMFEEPEIENNLKLVDQKIRAYWGLDQAEIKEDKKS